jgi:hypothetical protein
MSGTNVCGFRSCTGNHVLCTCTMMPWPGRNVYACECGSTVNGVGVFAGIGADASQPFR